MESKRVLFVAHMVNQGVNFNSENGAYVLALFCLYVVQCWHPERFATEQWWWENDIVENGRCCVVVFVHSQF